MVTWPPLQRRAPVLSRSTVRCSSGNFDSLHLLWYQLQSGFQSGLRSMQPARSLFASRYWNALSQIHASSPHGWMHQLPSSAETGTRGNERFPPAQLKSVFMGRRRGARRPNEMFKNKNKTLDFHCAACKVKLRVFKKAELSPDTPLAWKNKSRIFFALYHFIFTWVENPDVCILAPTWIPRTPFILWALVLQCGLLVFHYFDFLVVGTVPLPDISTVF